MRAALKGGAYTARSVIAGAQSCINLYGEPIEGENEPSVAYYPMAGLVQVGSAPEAGCRLLYRSKLGTLYGVYGNGLYAIDRNFGFQQIGQVAANGSRVSMADNGVIMAVVDGSTSGYQVTLASNAYQPIVSDAFYGADTVECLATYFLFNKIDLPQIYISDANALTFDPLYFANFAGQQDAVRAVVATHGTLALIGQIHTEWWTTSGAADLPFQPIPTASIDSGALAKFSVAKADNALFWLSQNAEGQGIAVISRGYAASRISTYAIETEWQSYTKLDDAIGWTTQFGGHTFYVLSFPQANRTWAMDLATGWWTQWGAFDGTTLKRHRGNSAAFAYGQNLVGDFETGALYKLDLGTYTDAGVKVARRRGFPHETSGGRRVFYTQFLADVETGTSLDGSEPLITLEWSDDRGATYTGLQTASLGGSGQAITSVQFQRLGMARDRVFRLTWDAPVRTALKGAWITSRAVAS